jgi:hypothetical protein
MGSLGNFLVRFIRLVVSIVGYLMVGYVFGPPAAVNRWFLMRAKAHPTSRKMRWISVDAIAAAWTGPAVAFVLLALYGLGANTQILGWMAVLLAIYVVVVLGFDPRFGHALIGALLVAVVGLVVAMALREAPAKNWAVSQFLWVFYECGVDFYPVPTAIIATVVALLVFFETGYELVVRRNTVDGNHYNLSQLFEGESMLKREDYHLEHDIPDFVEYRISALSSIRFKPTKDGLREIVQGRVPWGSHIIEHLRELTKETDVQIS